MKNYEYYLGNFSRRNRFINEFKSPITSNKLLSEQYKITLHNNTSFTYDVLSFLCEEHKNEIEVVELRDLINILNMHTFSPLESCNAIEELLYLNRYRVSDTDPNLYVKKENAFVIVDDYFNESDAEHFKELFDHFYVTRTIDVEDDAL